MEKNSIIPDIDLQNSRECYGLYNSRDFYKGRSFNFAEEWSLGIHYFNDEYITDFISYNGALLVCRISHISTEANRPTLLYQDSNDPSRPTGVSSTYWDFVFSGTSGATGENGQVYVPEYDQSSGNITWSLSKEPIDVGEFRVKGDKGDPGKGIESITKTKTIDNIDTYTIRYSTGETSTFTITNGVNGQDGSNGINGKNGRSISNISGPVKNGLIDTYTINYSDGTSSKFTVTNGTEGAQGKQGPSGKDGANGKNGKDGISATIRIDSVETGTPGSNASVINVGSATEAAFRFIIPRGERGEQGPIGIGEKGEQGEQGPEGKRVKLYRDFSDDTIKWGYDGEPISEWTVLCYMEYLRGVSVNNVEITDDAHLKFTLSSGHYTYKEDVDGNPIKDDNGNIIYDQWIPDTIITEGKAASTITLGKVEGLLPNQDPYIENVGTIKDPIWNIYIPQGYDGKYAIHIGPENPIEYKNKNLEDLNIQNAYSNPEEMIWVDTTDTSNFNNLNAVYHAYKEAGGLLTQDEFSESFATLQNSKLLIQICSSFEELGEPTKDKQNIIWIVPATTSSEHNLYEEYIIVENPTEVYQWEKWGSGTVETILSDYYTKEEATEIFLKKEEFSSITGQDILVGGSGDYASESIQSAIDDLNNKITNNESLHSITAKSNTTNYILASVEPKVDNTQSVVVDAIVGSVSNGDDKLATAADVKSYVDAHQFQLEWEEFD